MGDLVTLRTKGCIVRQHLFVKYAGKRTRRAQISLLARMLGALQHKRRHPEAHSTSVRKVNSTISVRMACTSHKWPMRWASCISQLSSYCKYVCRSSTLMASGHDADNVCSVPVHSDACGGHCAARVHSSGAHTVRAASPKHGKCALPHTATLPTQGWRCCDLHQLLYGHGIRLVCFGSCLHSNLCYNTALRRIQQRRIANVGHTIWQMHNMHLSVLRAAHMFGNPEHTFCT